MVVLLSSCKPVIIFLAGAHNPKPEDKESLIRYLDKKDIPADNILVLVDSTFFYRKHRDLGGIPEIQVFNKHGILINYKDTGSSCSGPAEFFTKAICSANVLSSNSSKTIESELSNVSSMVFSGDGSLVAVTSGDRYGFGTMAVDVYRLNDGQRLYKFSANKTYVAFNGFPATFSPDGKLTYNSLALASRQPS